MTKKRPRSQERDSAPRQQAKKTKLGDKNTDHSIRKRSNNTTSGRYSLRPKIKPVQRYSVPVTEVKRRNKSEPRRPESPSSAIVKHKSDPAAKRDHKSKPGTPANKTEKSHEKWVPVDVDPKITMNTVFGLDEQIRFLQRLINSLSDPLYSQRTNLPVARGVLLYGPPGTGKTNIVKALVNETRKNTNIKLFHVKSSDLLSEWFGITEQNVKTLFESAKRQQPSIIFMDEIDGLIPRRSGHTEQSFKSVTSAFLSLMDGLDSRGQVAVIGATNCPELIDPAFRRYGRFDRELYFAPPSREARLEMLKFYTRTWKPTPDVEELREIATNCAGYCGADIRALVDEAVELAYDQQYPRGTADAKATVCTTIEHIKAIMLKVKPNSGRTRSRVLGEPLSAAESNLFGSFVNKCLDHLVQICPTLVNIVPNAFDEKTTNSLLVKLENAASLGMSRNSKPRAQYPRLLIQGQGDAPHVHVAPAILHRLDPLRVLIISDAMCQSWIEGAETACVDIFDEAAASAPSVVYVPQIDRLWQTTNDSFHQTFAQKLAVLRSDAAVILIATSGTPFNNLPSTVKQIFTKHNARCEILEKPDQDARTDMFEDALVNAFQMNKAYCGKKEFELTDEEEVEVEDLLMSATNATNGWTADNVLNVAEEIFDLSIQSSGFSSMVKVIVRRTPIKAAITGAT